MAREAGMTAMGSRIAKSDPSASNEYSISSLLTGGEANWNQPRNPMQKWRGVGGASSALRANHRL